MCTAGSSRGTTRLESHWTAAWPFSPPSVSSMRNANPGRAVLADSGDLLQGSHTAAAFTPLSEGEVHPLIEAMNLMRYDAAALGNQEFSFGIEHLHRALDDTRVPSLAANVVDAASGEPVWPGGTLVELAVDGVPFRVASPGSLPPASPSGTGTTWRGGSSPPMLDRVRTVIPELQEAGADLVIFAAHSGLEGRATTRRLPAWGPRTRWPTWPARSPESTPSSSGTRTRRSPTRSSTASAWQRPAPTPGPSPWWGSR